MLAIRPVDIPSPDIGFSSMHVGRLGNVVEGLVKTIKYSRRRKHQTQKQTLGEGGGLLARAPPAFHTLSSDDLNRGTKNVLHLDLGHVIYIYLSYYNYLRPLSKLPS